MPAPVCADELRKVYDAIMSLSTGARVTTISFGDRSVTYGHDQLKALREMYGLFYRDCGADSGLVDLSGVGATRRGVPMTYRYF